MEVDVAIAGGGAAATAAALTIAASGLRAVVITPPATSGDRPGESLAPAGVALLEELGIAARFSSSDRREHLSTYASWGANALAQTNAIANVNGAGWVLDRSSFDRILRAEIEKTMETLDAPVEGVTRDGAWWHVHAGNVAVRARFIIDCSGRRAFVARTMSKQLRADRMVAAYSVLHSNETDVDVTPATMIEAREDGWWYAALLPDGRMAIAFFSDADLMPRGLMQDAAAWENLVARTTFVRQWLESASFRVSETPQIASAATTWLKAAAGEGWAAAGDAAVAFDPLSSHGLSSALWSGRRAAEASIAALSGKTEPLQKYAETFQRAVDSFLTQRAAIYSREQRFTGARFWMRRHQFLTED